MRRLAVAVLCVLALGACGKNDKKDSSGTATTVTTTASTTSTSTTIPSGPAQTPQGAADGLYGAWVGNNQDDASRYAKPQAITKLFAHPYSSATKYDRQPCTPVGGQFNCVWTYEGGSLQMTVENWPGGGYVVDSIIYVAD
ncbi:MAG TPA: hypothetical protein VHC63_06610 [Acidimicrobiales bacterium]|nr:hypothetical protein [Acidimicrobiales bacterium]